MDQQTGRTVRGIFIDNQWRESLGGGAIDVYAPAEGKVFTIDTGGTVRAFDANSGRAVWSARFGEIGENASAVYGGGVAYDNGRV